MSAPCSSHSRYSTAARLRVPSNQMSCHPTGIFGLLIKWLHSLALPQRPSTKDSLHSTTNVSQMYGTIYRWYSKVGGMSFFEESFHCVRSPMSWRSLRDESDPGSTYVTHS